MYYLHQRWESGRQKSIALREIIEEIALQMAVNSYMEILCAIISLAFKACLVGKFCHCNLQSSKVPS